MIVKTAKMKAKRGAIYNEWKLLRQAGRTYRCSGVVWYGEHKMKGEALVLPRMRGRKRIIERIPELQMVPGVLASTYTTWRGMVDRCTRASHRSYSGYGARGIKVFEVWTPEYWRGIGVRGWRANAYAFHEFVSYMGPKPSGTQLDRKDPDGNYEPGNIQWLTLEDHKKKTKKDRQEREDAAAEAALRDVFGDVGVVDSGLYTG